MNFIQEQQADDEKIALWNTTERPLQSDLTLDKLFIKQAELTPYATALIDEHHSMTYKELDERSNQLANYIVNNCFSGHLLPDTLIGIVLERSFDTVITILAILKAGAAYVPIDPSAPKHRMEYILANSQCQLIITHPAFEASIANDRDHLLVLTKSIYSAQPSTFISTTHKPHHLAYVIYTSGTTGNPKGVAIQHLGIVNCLIWMQKEYPLNSNDIILQKTPYTFDVSILELLLAHHAGAAIFIPKPNAHQNPQDLFKILINYPITVMHFVPSMLNAFNKYLKDKKLSVPKSLRYVFCIGEALFPSQVNGFYELCDHHPEIHNLYGPTEASVIVTYTYCKPGCEKVYIGKPIQNIKIHILTEELKTCKIGEIGELYIEGIGLARDYIHQPQLTDERFIDWNGRRLYKTGDLASWASEGELEYFGRNDSQVKIRGYRIELGEIEQVLVGCPGITHAAILCKTRGEQVYLEAFYQATAPIEHNKIVEYLKTYLPDYMIPNYFVFLDEFPLNSNGKLCRKTLSTYEYHTTTKTNKPAKTRTQTKLVNIWKTALELDKVSIDDNFFFLGGNSLTAAHILSMIEDSFKKHIEMGAFYKAATIENLEKLIKKAPKSITLKYSHKFWLKQKKLPLSEFQVLLWLANLFEPRAKKFNIVSRKRFQGDLNLQQLNLALNQVIKTQKVLNYKIGKITPFQYENSKNKINSSFEVYDLSLGGHNEENKLKSSMEELIKFEKWRKNNSFIKARYFKLENNKFEIQLCLSHLISDEYSMQILWEALSEHYLKVKCATPQASFRDYIIEDQHQNEILFEDKKQFWQQYLASASLFSFPHHMILNHDKKKTNYSAYYEFPEPLIHDLQNYCATQNININAILSSVLALTLEPFCQTQGPKKPTINIIKSTRNHHKYKSTIGCMIRVEPTIISIDKNNDILSLAKNTHDELISMSKYQCFSSIIKFAYYANCFKLQKKMSSNFVRYGMPIYTKFISLLKIPYLNFKPLHFVWYLAAFDKQNTFSVNLNIWNNFLTNNVEESKCFGLEPCQINMVPYELLKIDGMLDVSLIREHSNHKPYLVLSGNLNTTFKNELAEKFLYYCQQINLS